MFLVVPFRPTFQSRPFLCDQASSLNLTKLNLAKPIFTKAMQLVRINYKANLIKMIISGILGVWLHVFIDAIYHYDVLVFWPSKVRPLWRLLSKTEVVLWCKLSFVGVVILYIFAARSFNKRKKQSN